MVNQRFAFAVHIMAALAFHDHQMGSRSLALSVNTNPVVVRRLLLALRRAGLVKTSAGRSGGSRLAKPAKRITLLQIYQAVELPPVVCLAERRIWRNCPVSCNIKHVMSNVAVRVEQAVRTDLRHLCLEQLVREIQRKNR